jgi:glycosyltransferase involved in cell wall biosynthesis
MWENKDFDEEAIIYWKRPISSYKKIKDLLYNNLSFRIPYPFSKLSKIGRNYDLVISTPPGPIYFHTHPHSIVYDAGWARDILSNSRNLYRMAAKVYTKSKMVIFTNPDMYPLFERMDISPVFLPFAIDVCKYKGHQKGDDDIIKIFSSTRQSWVTKLNHHLIYAVSRLISDYPSILLTLTEWGTDVYRSKQLINNLKLQNHVEWIPPVEKDELIHRYNDSSIVADQFGLGSYGLAAPEAMAIGKPVLIYINEKYSKLTFGEVPPVANCSTISQIENELRKLIDDNKYRKKLESNGPKWVEKMHNPVDVTIKQLELFQEVLSSS